MLNIMNCIALWMLFSIGDGLFQCYLSAIMHELNNSLCNFADVYFKDVSAQLELICHLGPHAWYTKEN